MKLIKAFIASCQSFSKKFIFDGKVDNSQNMHVIIWLLHSLMPPSASSSKAISKFSVIYAILSLSLS
jgi:hypothetical protein